MADDARILFIDGNPVAHTIEENNDYLLGIAYDRIGEHVLVDDDYYGGRFSDADDFCSYFDVHSWICQPCVRIAYRDTGETCDIFIAYTDVSWEVRNYSSEYGTGKELFERFCEYCDENGLGYDIEP